MASFRMVSYDGVNYVVDSSLRVASDSRYLRFDLCNLIIELLFGFVEALRRALAFTILLQDFEALMSDTLGSVSDHVLLARAVLITLGLTLTLAVSLEAAS
jgi:hypothetical protein